MKAMAGTPTAGVLVRACGTSLREVAATVTDDGERLVLIKTLEATYWASQPDSHYRKNPVLTEAGTR